MYVRGTYSLRERSDIAYYSSIDNGDIEKCTRNYKVPKHLSVDDSRNWNKLSSRTTVAEHNWRELAEDDGLVAEIVIRSVSRARRPGLTDGSRIFPGISRHLQSRMREESFRLVDDVPVLREYHRSLNARRQMNFQICCGPYEECLKPNRRFKLWPTEQYDLCRPQIGVLATDSIEPGEKLKGLHGLGPSYQIVMSTNLNNKV